MLNRQNQGWLKGMLGCVAALAFAFPAFAQSKAEDPKGDAYPLDICMVSGKKLDGAGKPVAHDYKGRSLLFCSAECVKAMEADPAAYLNKLDKAIIRQQLPLYPLKTCVVSGEELGGMGTPVDYVWKNRLVRFCCNSCVKSFEKEPAKYIAKLDEAVVAQQKDSYPLNSCVVSGEELGGMGAPVDHVNGNRLVRFCCGGCLKSFNEYPAKYTAKLDAAIIERDKKDYPLDTCVISGEKLGEMGAPVDYVYGNRLVRFCCNGCIAKFEKDPQTALDKIDTAYNAKGKAVPGAGHATGASENKATESVSHEHEGHDHEGHAH